MCWCVHWHADVSKTLSIDHDRRGEMTLSATIWRQISVTWIIHNMGWNALPIRGGRGGLPVLRTGKTFSQQYNNSSIIYRRWEEKYFNLQNVPDRLYFCSALSHPEHERRFFMTYFSMIFYEFRMDGKK